MTDINATRMEAIQNRINQYGIRFPVATLAKELEMNKGYISGVLNGQKPVSDNFWETFNQKYPEKKNGTGKTDPHNTPLPPGNIVRTLADYIEMIEFYNRTLSHAISEGLIQMKVNLKEGQEQIKEQLAILGDDLNTQLEGISSGLAAAAKSDKAVSARAQKNVKGNNSR